MLEIGTCFVEKRKLKLKRRVTVFGRAVGVLDCVAKQAFQKRWLISKIWRGEEAGCVGKSTVAEGTEIANPWSRRPAWRERREEEYNRTWGRRDIRSRKAFSSPVTPESFERRPGIWLTFSWGYPALVLRIGWRVGRVEISTGESSAYTWYVKPWD